MKRRTFNQAALATLVAAAGQPLATVFPDKRWALERIREIPDTYHNNVGIGIGSEGRRLALALNTLLDPKRHGFIYADTTLTLNPKDLVKTTRSPIFDPPGSEWEHTVLIFALDDSEAWPRIVTWSLRMKKLARLRVAIVSVHDLETALSHPVVRWLKTELDTVILHPENNPYSYPLLFDPMVHTAMVFFETRRWPAYDPGDAPRMFTNAGIAIVTANLMPPVKNGGCPSVAAQSCFKQLWGVKPQKLFSTWFGGFDMSSDNLDASLSIFPGYLANDAPVVNTFLTSPAVPEGGHQLLHAIWVMPKDLGPFVS
jgi:hypothetical protein